MYKESENFLLILLIYLIDYHLKHCILRQVSKTRVQEATKFSNCFKIIEKSRVRQLKIIIQCYRKTYCEYALEFIAYFFNLLKLLHGPA